MAGRIKGAFYFVGKLVLTLAFVSAATAAAMYIPSILFIQGVPLVSLDAPQENLTEVAITIRAGLTDKYFSWAIVSISICGAILWRTPRTALTAYARTLIVLSFLLSSISIVTGVGFLELLALSVSVGVPLSEADGHYMLYPQVQFATTASAFLMATIAAIAAILRTPRSLLQT